MREKRLAILQHGDQYVAGVFSSVGLYAVTLPANTLEGAISSVNGEGIKSSNEPKDLQILELVFKIMNGEKVDANHIKFDFSDLTTKQIQVLRTTLKIPYGTTRSYGEIAQESDIPNAARFVGNVMSSNRFPPIIPCHRVVARNGIGGYGAGDGISTKIAILKAEGVIRGVFNQNPLFC